MLLVLQDTRRIGEWSWNTKPGRPPFRDRLDSYIMICMKWAGNITPLLEAVYTPIRKIIIKAIVFLTGGRQFSPGPLSVPRSSPSVQRMDRQGCGRPGCTPRALSPVLLAGRHRHLPSQGPRAALLPWQRLLQVEELYHHMLTWHCKLLQPCR